MADFLLNQTEDQHKSYRMAEALGELIACWHRASRVSPGLLQNSHASAHETWSKSAEDYFFAAQRGVSAIDVDGGAH
ncbi:MAG: hypothetical protein ACLGRW_16505 [Acidobacteriota bacterium]